MSEKRKVGRPKKDPKDLKKYDLLSLRLPFGTKKEILPKIKNIILQYK